MGIDGVTTKEKGRKKEWEAGDGDELDAFRHSFVNAVSLAWGNLISSDNPHLEILAKMVGNIGELSSWNSCSSEMDLFNNSLGISLAPNSITMTRWILGGENPQQKIAEIIASAIRKGEAITDFDDARMKNKQCALQTKKKGKYYVWRTKDDSDVRWQHAVRNGQIFAWNSPPSGGHPGSDFGCRCWAEPLDMKYENDLEKSL